MANENITNNMCENNPIFKYLCPTLLSENDILKELKARCFKIKGLERKSRDELTEIFIRHLMPLPQRTFPNNHHGKLINKMIQKESFLSRRGGKAEERKTTLQYGFSDKKQDSKVPPSSSSSSAGSSTSISAERLKPPIDSSLTHNRKISLTKSPSSSSNSSLDKIIIKDRSKERKNSSESDGHRRNSDDGDKEIKNVERKRSHSSESNEDTSPSKKSKQRIAWP